MARGKPASVKHRPDRRRKADLVSCLSPGANLRPRRSRGQIPRHRARRCIPGWESGRNPRPRHRRSQLGSGNRPDVVELLALQTAVTSPGRVKAPPFNGTTVDAGPFSAPPLRSGPIRMHLELRRCRSAEQRGPFPDGNEARTRVGHGAQPQNPGGPFEPAPGPGASQVMAPGRDHRFDGVVGQDAIARLGHLGPPFPGQEKNAAPGAARRFSGAPRWAGYLLSRASRDLNLRPSVPLRRTRYQGCAISRRPALLLILQGGRQGVRPERSAMAFLSPSIREGRSQSARGRPRAGAGRRQGLADQPLTASQWKFRLRLCPAYP